MHPTAADLGGIPPRPTGRPRLRSAVGTSPHGIMRQAPGRRRRAGDVPVTVVGRPPKRLHLQKKSMPQTEQATRLAAQACLCPSIRLSPASGYPFISSARIRRVFPRGPFSAALCTSRQRLVTRFFPIRLLEESWRDAEPGAAKPLMSGPEGRAPPPHPPPPAQGSGGGEHRVPGRSLERSKRHHGVAGRSRAPWVQFRLCLSQQFAPGRVASRLFACLL